MILVKIKLLLMMKNPSLQLKEWWKKLLLMPLPQLKPSINLFQEQLPKKLLYLKSNNQKKKFKELKNLMMLKLLKLKCLLLKMTKTRTDKLKALKILLFLLKKKKYLQNCYLQNVKLSELLSQMPKIKLKMEKKPILNQLLYYKKSKLSMELMPE